MLDLIQAWISNQLIRSNGRVLTLVLMQGSFFRADGNKPIASSFSRVILLRSIVTYVLVCVVYACIFSVVCTEDIELKMYEVGLEKSETKLSAWRERARIN